MHVLTCGTFDLFHPGHVFLLRECWKLTTLTSIISTDGTSAGGVIVGLNPDDFAATFKPRPIMTYAEREAMLRGCRYVDEVVENVHGNTAALLDKYKPGFLVIGQDWATRDYYAQIGVTQAELDAMNVSLLYVPRPADTISSTEIKARLAPPAMQIPDDIRQWSDKELAAHGIPPLRMPVYPRQGIETVPVR